MLDLRVVKDEPPMIEFTYPVNQLSLSFQKLNDISNFPPGSRNYAKGWNEYGQGKEIDQFCKDFTIFKKDIVLKLLSLDNLTRYHKIDSDKLIDNLKISMFPLIDKPGYNMGWHLDHRLIFANGILNVTDNESNTEFSNSEDGAISHTMSGTANIGTFWLSTEKSWHKVTEITRDRYVIAFSLSFYEL
jgi:hypothetical protein